MSQQRALELLRQAAAALERGNSTTSSTSNTDTATTANTSQSATSTSRTMAAVRNIFAPYQPYSANRTGARGRRFNPTQARSFWTHRFCVLGKTSDNVAPTREEKDRLYKANLGEKKISFEKNDDATYLKSQLEEQYPKLSGIGGFELLRTQARSRCDLEVISVPPGGYTVNFLSNQSNLGQAVCYIRPIQNNLSLEGQEFTDDDGIQEECIRCHMMIPLRLLREHAVTCGVTEEDEVLPPFPKKRNVIQTPVKETESGVCPVCDKIFPIELLPEHADVCCQSDEVCQSGEAEAKHVFNSFDDYLSSKTLNGEKLWDISVIRRMLVQQAMEEIEQAPEEEWNRKFCITFIGEEGLDSGGLTREFLTLLYDHSPVFENSVLSFDAQLLEKKHYFLMGQMVTMGILSGHPGPRNLMKHVVDYIVSGRTTGITDIPVDQLGRLDAVSAIQEMIEKYGDLLEACGFRKVLSVESRQNAVSAMKSYYLFNRFIPSLLQFVEGLKLHGMLDMLRKCPEKAYSYLMQTEHVDSLTIKAEKEDEEVILCNFHQFLKKLERGKISCISIDAETGSSSEVNLNTGHLLQALIGCPALPSCITEGIITFDHKSDYLTTVNTCAPSINFSKLSVIKNYSSFEELMKNVIVGSYGFGRE
ncbi:G2E3-like protein [Mya arenaria]|uniref:G2E3-like protein n=1 Tax=Mya arenaria TaxID=6604 RepID=A0ABY7FDL3_MYAAR|nr:G2E3-like protein [Mya arenaria]